MQAQSVDHVVTDPPYDDETQASQVVGDPHKVGRRKERTFAPLSGEQRSILALEFARLVRRWIVVFCSIEDVRGWRDDLRAAGLEYVQTMIWHKTNAPPQFTGLGPAQACEAIVVAHQKGMRWWNGRGSHGYFEEPIVMPQTGDTGDGTPRIHETQKPIRLMRQLVALFTDPDDVVFDPFMGSGTTGAACLELGRSFVGCDQDETNVANATKRILRAMSWSKSNKKEG